MLADGFSIWPWIFVPIVIGAVWVALRRGSGLFRIVIRDGALIEISGKPPPRFLSDISDLAQRHAIGHLIIRGDLRDGRTALTIRGADAEEYGQMARNLLALS